MCDGDYDEGEKLRREEGNIEVEINLESKR